MKPVGIDLTEGDHDFLREPIREVLGLGISAEVVEREHCERHLRSWSIPSSPRPRDQAHKHGQD
jgi:hypothetical protein